MQRVNSSKSGVRLWAFGIPCSRSSCDGRMLLKIELNLLTRIALNLLCLLSFQRFINFLRHVIRLLRAPTGLRYIYIYSLKLKRCKLFGPKDISLLRFIFVLPSFWQLSRYTLFDPRKFQENLKDMRNLKSTRNAIMLFTG